MDFSSVFACFEILHNNYYKIHNYPIKIQEKLFVELPEILIIININYNKIKRIIYLYISILPF